MLNEQGEVARLADALDRFSTKADKILSNGNHSVSKVEFHGTGHVWGSASLGFVCGGVLVGAMIIGLWVATAMGDMADDQRQDDAFIQATYQAVPGLRERFEQIKAEQAANQE